MVYNVSESSLPRQVEEASWAVTGKDPHSSSVLQLFYVPLILCLWKTALHAASESFKAEKMFILVSSVMGWATTAPKDPVRIKKTRSAPPRLF